MNENDIRPPSAHKRFADNSTTKYTWEYSVRVPTGVYSRDGKEIYKQVTRSGYPTKNTALNAGYIRAQEAQTKKLSLGDKPTFKEVCDIFFEHIEDNPEYAKKTVKNYKGYYKNHLEFFHYIKIENIQPMMIQKWRKEKMKETTCWVINGCRKFSIAAVNFCINNELYYSRNPFEKLEKVEEPIIYRNRLDEDEVRNFLDSCKIKNYKLYPVFILCFSCGMRIGEVLGLKWTDIDFENEIINIQRQYTDGEIKARCKTRKSHRIVDISISICKILKEYRIKRKILSEFIFMKETGKLIDPRHDVEEGFYDLMEELGYDRKFMRVHDSRGNFVDFMLNNGFSLAEASRDVGHARVQTTGKWYSQRNKTSANRKKKLLENKLFNNN